VAAKVRWDRGAWWVMTHHQGKRRKKRIGATKADKRQAEAIARKINAALALGDYGVMEDAGKALACDAELRRWHRTYSPTMKLTSEISTRGLIENHLAPYFGATDLREIREADLLGFARSKMETGLSPKTVKNALSVLRRVYYLAQREGLVNRNPAARIGELMRRVDRRLSSEVREVETWTRDEVERLLALAREHEPSLYPALLLLFSTGVRRGEVLGLKWGDVNFDRREITIRRSITARQVTTPKSGRSRVVVMPEGLASELFNLLALRRREGLARGWPEVSEWVFCSKSATPLDERNFSRVWYRLRRRAQKAGIRPLKLHATRHTWATFALQAGKSVRWVADQLGHADPALTLRVYAHAMTGEERDLSFAEFDAPGRPYTAPASEPDSDEPRKSPDSLVGRQGLEPWTIGLKARCSTS
jgi:integrase